MYILHLLLFTSEFKCIGLDISVSCSISNLGCSVIPHPPWPLLISDVGLELEGTLINCSLL